MKRFFKIVFFLLFLNTILNGQDYVSGSLLSSGKWFRIAVTGTGVYRIDYAQLKQLGLDYPSYPRIYGNNTGQLSFLNDGTAPDDLKELPVYVSGNDQIVDNGEYVLFFSQGTGRWQFDTESGDYFYKKHYYSDTAFYFITSFPEPGRRIIDASQPQQQPVYYSSSSDVLFRYEKDESNLLHSGREWFQRISDIKVNPGFTDLLAGDGIKYRMRVAARASVSTIFRLYEGTTLRKSIQVAAVNLSNYTGTYAEIADSSGSFGLTSASPEFGISFFNNGESGAYGWLDFLELRARRPIIFNGSTTIFFDAGSVSPGRVAEFTISREQYDPVIWDVTDPFNIRSVTYYSEGDLCKFKFIGDTLRSFAAFLPGKALSPKIDPAMIMNQDLHGSLPSDMIIVTHPMFIEYAAKLDEIHREINGLVTQIVTPQQIYNEFSGGIPDICAIRNFVRMKYLRQKESGDPLKYLLLLGDGSYDNKTPAPRNPNFIPTYQSVNSNVAVASFTSDDFYGLLDDNEGEAEGTEDIGIGRLPVSGMEQAEAVIEKIRMYLDPSSMGDWRNIVCLTADDEDGNIHISDAEKLAGLLQDSLPFINTEKIYLDAYKQATSAGGQSYPDVSREINDRINNGCLIFNYVGHGNENGLAHERVVRKEDITSWRNKGRLPLFITATCEFSRFDDMEINPISGDMEEISSAGEMVLLNSEGGGIALMSTTRLVYSAPNFILNRNIFDCAFDRDAKGNPLCLGDIIRTAKNNAGNGQNKRNFTLLGDPALSLVWPWHGNVITDSVNNIPVAEGTDSLKALSLITIAGHLEDNSGNILNSFNGVVSPRIFDKPAAISTLANDGGNKMEFETYKNMIFSGNTRASSGRFRFTFIVPRDIDYTYGKSKISYYAKNDAENMTGYFSDLIAGGFSNPEVTDTEGPDIRLFMNDTLFRSGGTTDADPRLLAIIEDKGGINTSGSAIGHDLSGYLDDSRSDPLILNKYFENDFDSYTKGRLTYNLNSLSKGEHSFTLKVWDNFNNSSEEKIIFLVADGNKFILKNLISYPNPFMNDTRISAEHNRPEDILEITIRIFSINGSLIKILRTTAESSGYVIPPVIWDGTDDRGNRAGRGLYPYSVTVTSSGGETARASGRLIIL